MIKALVGYTGFVGSNILKATKFDHMYNSKNIGEAYGLEPDLLVYAGVPAEMFLANSNPEADLEIIKDAINNIKKINPKQLVLISTVAVYSDITDGDEDTKIDKSNLSPYGKNRLFLEEWVEKNISNYLIVRLPAIYGENLKKNFIYDYINFIPKLLKKEKYIELCTRNKKLSDFYEKRDADFYRCKTLNKEQRKVLMQYFEELDFSALNFTDSRNIYQFFNLSKLWEIIVRAMGNNICKLNIVTEPVSVQELYFYLERKNFVNEINPESKILKYNLKTRYSEVLSEEKSPYLLKKEEVLKDIENYIMYQRKQLI